MQKLWSPWRSQYIESFKNGKRPESCIFCDAAKQNIDDDENLLVNKSELTFTLLNLYPYNNGHLMIVPYRHISDMLLLNENENKEIMNQLQLSIKALTKVLHPEGFNIGVNMGRTSGAGIDDHLHFHVVPRWNGDTNFMPVLGEVKVISQDLLVTKNNLIKAYSELK